MSEYIIPRDEEKKILDTLKARHDADAARMKRYLAMPDLSRTPESPIKELVDKITSVPDFKNFDRVDVPEIVPTDIAFDLFDFAADHPARSPSDTYFADDTHLLRPHTTVMWYYYLTSTPVKERLAKGEDVGVFSFGKVYRKDEIDKTHMNVFHQIDGLYLCPKKKKTLQLQDLQDVEEKAVKSVFGAEIAYRFHEETFPYTHPSTEIEIKKGENWIEILGSGVVKGSVLEKLGVDQNVYNAWAFGFGLERWAIISMELPDIRLLWSKDPRVTKQLRLGQKYKEVSKYPAVVRDISFVVGDTFTPNDYFDLIRETVGEEIVEEVKLIDTYKDAKKFGAGKVSYAYRIVYRSQTRTLTNAEVDALHKQLESATTEHYGAQLR
jgi:phenylalanyl-tRNA synthetase alpha chain